MLKFIGILVGFIVILILVRRRVSYGLSMIVGAFLIGLFSVLLPSDYLIVIKNTLTDPDTLRLSAIIVLINMVGYSLKKTGQIDRVLTAAAKIFGERAILGIIPSIFALMPMPGGALMSAPVMEPKADELGVNAEEKTFINLWFRHIWFFIYPLDPALILAASLAGVNIYGLIIFLTPAFFISLVLGIWYGLRHIPASVKSISSGGPSCLEESGRLLWSLLPIIIALLLNILLGLEFYYGLAIGLGIIFAQNRINPRRIPKMLKEGFSLDLLLAIVGIMFFRHMGEYSGAVAGILSLLQNTGIPTILILITIPFFVGLITGANTPAIGIALPLFLPLLPRVNPLYASLLYMSIQLGYLGSPLHLCLVVTREYFKSNLSRVYRTLAQPIGVLFIYNLALQLILLGVL